MARDSGDRTRANDGAGRTGETGTTIDRRSYLQAAGIAAGSLALGTGQASAATEFEYAGIRFKHRVNMVEDAGCKPDGSEPCDEIVREQADNNTLLEFPEGTYRFEESNVLLGYDNLGFRGLGDRGTVTFTVPENLNEKILLVDVFKGGGSGLLFENIDIDQTAEGATPGLHFGTDDNLVVRDVELIGQGIHPESEPIKSGRSVDGDDLKVYNGLMPIIYDEDGTGLVENFVAHNKGLMGSYTRVGIWIGKRNKGTVNLRDCDVQGFPNNGLYCSRTYGVVQVEGGTFKNNDISQVRIGSEGSYVKDATIGADLQNGRSPNPQDTLNTRGVRLESGGPGDARGGTVENCDITIASTPNSSGGIVAAGTHGDFGVADTRVRVDVDRVRAVYAKYPDGGLYDVPEKPRSATIQNVEITGSAIDTEAIRIEGRHGSTIEASSINEFGARRDGVRLVNTEECAIKDTAIEVPGRSIVREDATATASNVDGASSASLARLPNTLEIGGTGSYDITLNAAAYPDSDRDAATRTIQGSVSGEPKTYRFAGYATDLSIEDGVSLRRNGESIEPIDLRPSTLVIDGIGAGRRLDYEFTVDAALQRHAVDGATANPEDEIDGTTARGAVQGGRDAYVFAGDITFEVLDQGATAIVNGREIYTGPPSVTPNGNLPEDPDGDQRYEDLDGDGDVDVLDVQKLFANRNNDRIKDNAVRFDFNGDGSVSVLDVQKLFSESR